MDSSTLHSAAARSRRRPIAFRAVRVYMCVYECQVGTRALRYSCRAGSGNGALRPLQAAGKRRNMRMDVSFQVAVLRGSGGWGISHHQATIRISVYQASGIRNQEYVPSNVHAAQAGRQDGRRRASDGNHGMPWLRRVRRRWASGCSTSRLARRTGAWVLPIVVAVVVVAGTMRVESGAANRRSA